MFNIRVAKSQLFNFPRIDIDADHGEAALVEQQHKGEAHIAKTDDTNGGFSFRDFLEECFFRHRTKRIRAMAFASQSH